jgi:hypothetical protein
MLSSMAQRTRRTARTTHAGSDRRKTMKSLNVLGALSCSLCVAHDSRKPQL